jgi:hypothetical protein
MTTTHIEIVENLPLSDGQLLYVRREIQEMLAFANTPECRTPEAFLRFMHDMKFQPFYFVFVQNCWNVTEIKTTLKNLQNIVKHVLKYS